MEKIKSDIINTAADLFKKYSLRSVSIDDVCKELHISKKTFYNYFKQKEQLIEEVMHYFREESKKYKLHYMESRKDKNVIDILMDYDKSFKKSMEENKKYFALYYDLEKYYPLVLQRCLKYMQKDREDSIKELILRGLTEDVFRKDMDIDLMAEHIALLFQNTLNFISKKNSDLYQRFHFLKDLIIRISANEEGMDYYLKNYYDK